MSPLDLHITGASQALHATDSHVRNSSHKAASHPVTRICLEPPGTLAVLYAVGRVLNTLVAHVQQTCTQLPATCMVWGKRRANRVRWCEKVFDAPCHLLVCMYVCLLPASIYFAWRPWQHICHIYLPHLRLCMAWSGSTCPGVLGRAPGFTSTPTS